MIELSLTKEKLESYTDACKLIEELDAEIKKLSRTKPDKVADVVKGSSSVYPFTEVSFKIEGYDNSSQRQQIKAKRIRMLEEQKRLANETKLEIESELSSAPIRIQRIIRYRYFEKHSWRKTARMMGASATEESVRKELERYFKE